MPVAPEPSCDAPRSVGLSSAEAARRLATVGANQLARGPRKRFVGRLARQLVEPLSLLLLAAVVLSLVVLDERTEGIAILAVVVLDAVFGALQEHRADAALAALRDLTAPTARLWRDGHVVRLDAAEVVPGDVVELTAGDLVPADLRLVEAHALATDEASLTGESLPVSKSVEAAEPADDRPDGDGRAFAGTVVVRGRGTGEVVDTGARTELGRLARSLGGSPPVPLEQELHRLGRALALVAVAAGVVLVPVAALRSADAGALPDAVLAGVALMVAAVPEGLPAAVTASLALGAQHMARGGAIVRRLAAIESLGATSVLCVDKTGTLTTGHLAVDEVSAVAGREPDLWLAALRANDAAAGGDDPVDRALLLGAPAGIEAGERTAEQPFDAEEGLMATVHHSVSGPVLSVKGAPETVLARCAPGADRDEVEAAVQVLAAAGAKVLAVADGATDDLAAGGLRPLGAIALADRLRTSALPSVEACRRAGIRLVMVTGDHRDTAVHVAGAAGLDTANVVTEADLVDLDPPARARVLEAADVVARVRPGTKLELVDAHRSAGRVVGMTGDGVNDAPALAHADVGVALAGDAGTDVARQAADLVITDGRLGTIVSAVSAGRRIYRNLTNVVAYLVAGNLSELLIMAGGFVVIPELAVPLLPVQLLWINLVTDGVPALALGVDEPGDGLLDRPPRDPSVRLLGSRTIAVLALRAAAVVVAVLGTTALVRWWGWTPAAQRTQLMLSLLFVHLALAYVTRAEVLTFHRGWWRGRIVAGGVAASIGVTVLAMVLAPVRSWLGLVPLPPAGWSVALVAVVVAVLLIDVGRVIARHR